MMKESGSNVFKSDFPIFATQSTKGQLFHYLDSAASALKPQQVIDAITDYYTQCPVNIHRATYAVSELATERYENVREKTAQFINACQSDEIIFTKGTTESINLLAHAWCPAQMKPGDTILLTPQEHHSNMIPWRLVAERHGFNIDYLPLLPDGALDMSKLDDHLTPSVKILSVNQMSNVLGTVNPITELIEAAHKHHIPVCIDAAQSVAHTPLDVQQLACDFLAFSGHKMFGPTGTGVLYACAERQEEMEPFLGGGSMINAVSLDTATWADCPGKFEAGTPHVSGIFGLGAAIDFIHTINLNTIQQHEKKLTQYLEEQLNTVPNIHLLAPNQEHHGVISFVLDGIHPHDIAQFASEEGVAIRAGNLCAQPLVQHLGYPSVCRTSLSIYNEHHDIDVLTHALHAAQRFFS